MERMYEMTRHQAELFMVRPLGVMSWLRAQEPLILPRDTITLRGLDVDWGEKDGDPVKVRITFDVKTRENRDVCLVSRETELEELKEELNG